MHSLIWGAPVDGSMVDAIQQLGQSGEQEEGSRMHTAGHLPSGEADSSIVSAAGVSISTKELLGEFNDEHHTNSSSKEAIKMLKQVAILDFSSIFGCLHYVLTLELVN